MPDRPRYEKGHIGIGICLGFILIIIFTIFLGSYGLAGLLIAPPVGGLVAGLLARGGWKSGAIAGFGAGIIPVIIIVFLAFTPTGASLITMSGMLSYFFPSLGGLAVPSPELGILMNLLWPALVGAGAGMLSRGKPIVQQPIVYNYPPMQAPAPTPLKETLCTNCGSMSSDKMPTCPSCGNPLDGTCYRCSTAFRKGTIYCSNCGEKVGAQTHAEVLEEKLRNLMSQKEELRADILRNKQTIPKAELRLISGEIDQRTFDHIKEAREAANAEIEKKLAEIDLQIEDARTELGSSGDAKAPVDDIPPPPDDEAGG